MRERPLFDSEVYTRGRVANVTPKMPFVGGSPEEIEAWRQKLSGELLELLGGFPRRGPLEAEIVECVEFDKYTRERIHFQSREDLTVKAFLLLPKKRPDRERCMLCLPGHGRGVDEIVGIKEDGTTRTRPDEYQKDFAVQCAERGIAAFAVEPLGFGERRDAHARGEKADHSSCEPSSGVALMLGETMVAWRVWDVIRAIDYLETRDEIDAERIGAMGISGGGTVTFWGACLEPRIRVALVSGYFCTFDECIMAVPHCIDNYIPGICRLGDMPEFAGLIAPRPLFVESGTKDEIFRIDGAKRAVARAETIYEACGAEDRIGHEFFEGVHEFHGKDGFEFIEKWL